jgi:alcohol dehydrogenase YqhD (iron-dependent ADH family)
MDQFVYAAKPMQIVFGTGQAAVLDDEIVWQG